MLGTTGAWSSSHCARPFAEALGLDAVLNAALEHHLHADADAQDRASAGEAPAHDLVSARGAQALHDGRKGTNTRHDEAVGVLRDVHDRS